MPPPPNLLECYSSSPLHRFSPASRRLRHIVDHPRERELFSSAFGYTNTGYRVIIRARSNLYGDSYSCHNQRAPI